MTWPAQHHEYHRKYPLTGMYRWNSERLEGNAALPGLSGAGSCTKVCQQPDVLWSPLFRAPLKSVEQIWKEGRQATTEAVLTNAKLQVSLDAFRGRERMADVGARAEAAVGSRSSRSWASLATVDMQVKVWTMATHETNIGWGSVGVDCNLLLLQYNGTWLCIEPYMGYATSYA